METITPKMLAAGIAALRRKMRRDSLLEDLPALTLEQIIRAIYADMVASKS